jgi:hypothetical protein
MLFLIRHTEGVLGAPPAYSVHREPRWRGRGSRTQCWRFPVRRGAHGRNDPSCYEHASLAVPARAKTSTDTRPQKADFLT